MLLDMLGRLDLFGRRPNLEGALEKPGFIGVLCLDRNGWLKGIR